MFKYQKQNIQRALFWLISLSLGFSLIYLDSPAYYLLPTRAYQLLIGAYFVFVSDIKFSLLKLNLSLVFIIVSLFLPQSNDYLISVFKGGSISIATAFLLYYSNFDKQQSLMIKIIKHQTIIQIGKISYSLYLWHWVFLAFAYYIFGYQEALSLKVLLVCWTLTLIFSILCYLKIENPIRENKKIKFKILFIFYFVFLFSLFFIKNYNFSTKNYNLRTDKTICHDRIEENLCKRGELSSNKKVLILGDSHIAQYNRFFDTVGKYEKWQADVISVGTCTFIFKEKEWYLNGNQKHIDRCLKMHNFFEKNANQYNYIIIGGFWYEVIKNKDKRFNLNEDSLETEEIIIEKLGKHFSELGKLNIPVYVLADNYSLKKYSYKKARFQVLNGYQIEYLYLDEQKRINQLIKDLIAPYPNIHWIDKHLNLIPKNFQFNGLPIYYDEDHFNPYGAEKLAEQFIKSGAKLIR